MERPISSGRADIVFASPYGLVIVECKASPLENHDVLQLRRYIADLKASGETVKKGFLVGFPPIKPIACDSPKGEIEIYIRILDESIPLRLAWCGKHKRYFNFEYELCPLCGSPGDPNMAVDLSVIW